MSTRIIQHANKLPSRQSLLVWAPLAAAVLAYFTFLQSRVTFFSFDEYWGILRHISSEGGSRGTGQSCFR
jgi:hypothetical protein